MKIKYIDLIKLNPNEIIVKKNRKFIVELKLRESYTYLSLNERTACLIRDALVMEEESDRLDELLEWKQQK